MVFLTVPTDNCGRPAHAALCIPIAIGIVDSFPFIEDCLEDPEVTEYFLINALWWGRWRTTTMSSYISDRYSYSANDNNKNYKIIIWNKKGLLLTPTNET